MNCALPDICRCIMLRRRHFMWCLLICSTTELLNSDAGHQWPLFPFERQRWIALFLGTGLLPIRIRFCMREQSMQICAPSIACRRTGSWLKNHPIHQRGQVLEIVLNGPVRKLPSDVVLHFDLGGSSVYLGTCNLTLVAS